MSMFRLLKLEERIVLDGAAVLDALDADQAQDVHDQAIQDAADDAGDAHDADTGIDSQEPLFLDALEAVQEDAGLNVLVVSSDVSDGDDLAAAAKDDVLVVRYDAESTDLDQLADLIAGALDGQKADSIAFAAHSGNDASVYLTDNDVTTAASLDDAAQQAFWTAVSDNLADDGRIDLLGCDVVKGDDGEALLTGLEDLTGTNVAASSDATGNDAYGGDWVLESDGVDIAGTYFDADKLEAFDGVLLSGDDPDAGYNQMYDQTVPAGQYWLVKVPRANWTDVGGTGDADADITLSFKYDTNGDGNFNDAAPSWLQYLARNDGFLVKKAPLSADSVTVQVIAEDSAGHTSPPQTFVIDPYNPSLKAPTYADVTGAFSFTEGEADGTVVVPAAQYKPAATDTDGTIANYEIVSGNPTDGTNVGFEIDASGNIVIANSSLLIHNEDPYVTDNTYQLVVRAEDNDGIYATSTVEIDINQGVVKTDVTLSVDNPALSEDPADNDNAAMITVNLSVAPTAPVTIDLAYAGTGTNPADGSDYTAPTSVTFNTGETSVTAQLTVANDGVAEGSETFTVDINEATLPANYLDKATPVDMTIVDGKPTVSLGLDPVTFNENGQAVLTASLDVASDQAIIVPLTFSTGTGDALHGEDYTTTQDAITIAAGATQETLTLVGVVDNTNEGGSESFTISVTDNAANPFKIDATNGSVDGIINDVVVEKPIVSVTVENDKTIIAEGESVSILISLLHSDGTPYVVEEGTGGLTVGFDMSGAATWTDDYSMPTLITIPEGASEDSFTLSAKSDSDTTEGNEDIVGTISENTNYQVGTPGSFSMNLLDVTAPVVSLTSDVATISEPGDGVTDPTSATVTISRTATTETSTVQLVVGGSPEATEDVDYVATYSDGSTVDKAASGNWIVTLGTGVASETIKVAALADDAFEGTVSEQIVLTLGTISGSATADGTNNTTTIEITDVDAAAAPTVNLGVNADGVLPYDPEGTLTEDGTTEVMEAAIYLNSGDFAVEGLPVIVQIEATGDAAYEDDFIIASDSAGTKIDQITADDGTPVWALTIDPGAATVEKFYVVGQGADSEYEGNEAFGLSIHDVQNAKTGNASVTGEIADTITPTVTLNLDPASFSEVDDGATTTVNEKTATLTVNVNAGDGNTFAGGVVNVQLAPDKLGTDVAELDTDYEVFAADGTTPLTLTDGHWTVPVNVTAGESAGTATIVLSGLGDEDTTEDNESLTVTAEKVDGVEISTVPADLPAVTGTILNSDPPGGVLDVSLNAFTDPTEVGEAAGTTAIGVTLSRSSLDDVVVTMELGGDGVFFDSTPTDDVEDRDYEILDSTGAEIDVAEDGTFTFTIAAGHTSGFVTLQAIEDAVYEENESFTATIAGIDADGTVSTNTETGTIVESLAEPTVSLFFVEGTSEVGATTFSEAAGAQVVAKLDHASEVDITVNLNYVAGTTDGAVLTEDYNGPASITIPHGALQQTTSLVAVEDVMLEADETFEVQIGEVTNATADSANNIITGTIADNDADGAVQVWMEWASGDSELGEAAENTATLVVNLDRTTGNPITIDLEFAAAKISGADSTDYEITGATPVEGTDLYSVVIDGTATTAQVTLTGVDDGLLEGDEFFSITIDEATSFTGGEVAGNPPELVGELTKQTLTATVKDNTADPEVWITVDDTTIIEGVEVAKVTAHSTTAAQVPIEVYVEFNGDGTDTASGSGTDYSITGTVITIPAGETSSVTPVTIITTNDDDYEGDENLSLTIDFDTDGAGGDTGTIYKQATGTGIESILYVTIDDDETKPEVSLALADPAVTELTETGTLGIDVTLSGNVGLAGEVDADVIVTLEVGAEDTAVPVSEGKGDYTLTGATPVADSDPDQYTVTFTAGNSDTVTVTLTGFEEDLVDADKAFSMSIVGVSSTEAASISTTAAAVNVDVVDDDVPYVKINIADYASNPGQINELAAPDNDVDKIDIVLTDSAGAPLTPGAPSGVKSVVAIEFSDDSAIFGEDYTVYTDNMFSNEAVLEDGTNIVLVTVDTGVGQASLYLAGKTDDIFEADETITITAVENTANVLVNIGDPINFTLSQTVTVVNDGEENDAPTITLGQNSATTNLKIDEGTTDTELVNYADFDLIFDAQSQVETNVVLKFSGAQSDDYVVKYGEGFETEAALTAGSAENEFLATLTFGVDDLDVTDGASKIFRVEAVDDSLTTPKYEVDEEIVVSVATGTDYTPGTEFLTVTIQDDDEALIPKVVLEPVGDLVLDETITDDTESVLVKLVNKDDGTTPQDIGSDTTVTLKFSDGDILGVAKADADGTPEDGVTGDDYTLSFKTVNPDDPTDTSTTTVTLDETNLTASVVVPKGYTEGELIITVNNDTPDELNEDFDVRIVGVGDPTADENPTYDPIPVVGSIIDSADNAPAVTLGAWTNVTIVEADDDSGSALPTTSTLTATLDAESGKRVVVTLDFGTNSSATYTQGGGADDDVTDYMNNSHTLTFAPGDITASVTVYGVADDKFEVNPATTPSEEVLVADIIGVSTSEDTDGDGTIEPGTDDLDATYETVTPQTLTITDDVNDKPKVSLSLTPDSIYEQQGTAGELTPTATLVTLTLDKASSKVGTPVRLVFAGDGTPSADLTIMKDDVALTPAAPEADGSYIVTIPAEDLSYTFQVKGVNDNIYEANEVFTVDIVNTATQNAYAEEDTTDGEQQGTFTLMDGGDAPTITLAGSGDGELTEATTPDADTFTVTLDGTIFQDEEITLNFAGTAAQGDDYLIAVDSNGNGDTLDDTDIADATLDEDGNLTFTMPFSASTTPPQAIITVTTVDNTYYESDETVDVTVSDPGNLNYDDSSANFTITDDEVPVYVKLGIGTTAEGAGTEFGFSEGGFANVFAYLVNADGDVAVNSGADVTVTLAYDPDNLDTAELVTDYNSNDPNLINSELVSITIPKGASQGSTWISLSAVDNDVYEQNETFTVEIAQDESGVAKVTNAEASSSVAPTSVTGTILDDDAGPTVTMSVDKVIIPEAGGVATLTLSLSEASPGEEVIYVNITDTNADSTAGTWGTDAVYGPSFRDFGTIVVTNSDYAAYDESGTIIESEVKPETDGDDTETPDVIENQVIPVTIGTGDTTATVTLRATNDDLEIVEGDPNWLYEHDETFTVSIDDTSFKNNLTNDPSNVAHTVTITDDDEPKAPMVSLTATDMEATEDHTTLSDAAIVFTVDLDLPDKVNSGTYSQNIEVVISYAADDFEYSGTSTGTVDDTEPGTITLTFDGTSTTPAETATLTFLASEDGTYEGEEQHDFQITDVKFAKMDEANDSVTATVTDGDELTIDVKVNPNMDDDTATPYSASLDETDADRTATFFVIEKTEASSQVIYVDWEISGTAIEESEAAEGELADYVGATSGRVALSGDAGAQGIIDLTLFGDNLEELDDTIVVTLNGYRVGAEDAELVAFATPQTATLTITNDDAAPEQVANTGLTVPEGGTVDLGAEILAFSDADLPDSDEDGKLTDELYYQITDAPDNGTLYLNATSGDKSSATPLALDGVFTQEDIDNGDVWYQHDDTVLPETTADSFGFTVNDDLPLFPPADMNTTEGTFVITVTPENDAPVKDSIVFWVEEGRVGDVLSDNSSLIGDGIIITDQDGDTLTNLSLSGQGSEAFTLDANTPGELKLTLNTALDYEVQSSYTLVVHAEDADGVAIDTLVVVNVEDNTTDGGYVAGPVGTVDPVTIGETYVYQIDAGVFPDGPISTIEAASLSDISWLTFEPETQTFWYVPGEGSDPAPGTYTIQVTATYWNGETVSVDVPIEVAAPVVASLDAEMVNDALNYLESDEAEVLPEAGDALVIQDMMLASAAADYTETAEQTGEYADVLALLEDEQLAWTEDRMVG